MKQKIQKHLLFRIVTRLDLLLFFYILALCVVYVTGNYKLYIDEILSFLLVSMTFLGILLLLFSFVSIILSIVFFVREKKNIYLFYIILFVFYVFFSILIIFFTTSFEFISSGMKF